MGFERETDTRTPPARALFFGPVGNQLFAWHHSPREDARRSAAVILCPPLGFDYMSAYRGWRILAQRLANLGFDVLRFDYHGTGNSAGEPDEPDRVDAWLASIGRTVAAARAVAATDAVALVGFRLGATLALQAAAGLHSVDRLVLWSPFPSGKAYLRELRAFARLSVRDNVSDAPKRGDIEAAGFVLTEAAATALADVDLLSMTNAPAREVLLVDRDDRPVDVRLAERLRALGSRVTSVQPAGTAEALAEPGTAKVPEHIFDDITGWLGQWWPVKSERAAALDESLFTPAAESGTGYCERVVQFGDGERLFGVITEPCAETNPDTAIVFLNTGCEYNVGPHRLYVPLARHWALRGYLTLRFDLGGIGDSQPPPGHPENLPYPDHALDDVRAAVALVRGRPGIRRVILAGLCSGAWHAFRAACEGVRVEAMFLVNTPLFLGGGAAVRELSEVHELQRYGRSFRDPAKWAKALRGRAGYWTFIRLNVAMLFRKSTRFIRTALGADEPTGLGADLQRIAAQGIQGLFVFDSREEGFEHLRLCANPARLRRLTRGRFQQVEVEGAGHTFRPVEAQEALRRLLLDFVEGPRVKDR